jgi:hypothetical protein
MYMHPKLIKYMKLNGWMTTVIKIQPFNEAGIIQRTNIIQVVRQYFNKPKIINQFKRQNLNS